MGRITDFINRFMFGDKKVLVVRVYDKSISVMHYDGKTTKDHKIVCKNVGYNVEAKRDPSSNDHLLLVEIFGIIPETLQEGEY